MFASLFINMPVADVQRSKDFFSALGFEFNPQFTDDSTACLILTSEVSAMLSVPEKFQMFLQDKQIAPKGTNEAIFSFACKSAEDVRAISEKAFAAGARKVSEFEDHGFMVSWGFEDLDGHLWDLFFMSANPSA
jgi:predicted lactoylglutathione lyase